MVCADTNCIIAYLAGDEGADVAFLDKLLESKAVGLPPVVVAELVSDPALPAEAESLIRSLPELSITAGYWHRAGKLRAAMAKSGFSARLADTLIAQSCLDNGAPLLTRDKSFRNFRKVSALKLL